MRCLASSSACNSSCAVAERVPLPARIRALSSNANTFRTRVDTPKFCTLSRRKESTRFTSSTLMSPFSPSTLSSGLSLLNKGSEPGCRASPSNTGLAVDRRFCTEISVCLTIPFSSSPNRASLPWESKPLRRQSSPVLGWPGIKSAHLIALATTSLRRDSPGMRPFSGSEVPISSLSWMRSVRVPCRVFSACEAARACCIISGVTMGILLSRATCSWSPRASGTCKLIARSAYA
mmetsp:Transcript_587/g.2076  ORF Transcript_587/g.2076 Transcript_587/m.2076 type:complete len:234 (-) Transcript_587:7211-7912(-)